MTNVGNLAAEITMNVWSEEDFIKAFNLWLDDFTNNPQQFEEISKTAHRHLEEKLQGKEPSYGESVTATLFEYCNKTKTN